MRERKPYLVRITRSILIFWIGIFAVAAFAYFPNILKTEFAQAAPNRTTLGTGTDPSGATVAPGSGALVMDQFTFVLNNTATDSVTALVVTLAASGTPYSGIASVEIRGGTTCAGTLYYSAASNPSSNTVNFSGGTAIPVTNATSTYVICITPKTHANMPAVPGALYSLSPDVSDYTSSYKSGVNDSNVNTFTIDNESPTSATVPLASESGDGANTLNFTTSSSADISQTVILRWSAASPGAEVPVEGTSYALGNTIVGGATATVACIYTSVASTALSWINGTGGTAAACQTTALTNGQAYSYKVFTKDSRGNYDAGTTLNGSPLTPGAKITISGNLYASNESTAVTSGTVKMSIAGGTAVTTAAGALGAWTFSNVSQPIAGQVVTIWMDSGDNTGATNATLVFKYGTTCEGGTTSCTGLKLYQTKVIIGVDYNNTANSIANSDFAACDNDTGTGCNGDTDIGFTSNLSTTYNLAFTWTTYNVLRIKDANAKFSPAGNVTARQIDLSAGSFTTGSGTISVSATANPLTVSGGSLTISTNNTWIYTGGGMSVVPTYYNLTISGSGFALPSGTINVLNTLSIQTGVTAGGNPNVNTTFLAVTANLFTGSGTWTISGTGTPLTGSASNYTFSNGNTFVYTGNGATIFTDSYFNLELKPNGNSDQVLSSGNIAVSGNLVIGDGTAGHAGATAVANDPMISLSGTLTIAANATFTTSDLASSTFIMSSATPTITVNGTLTISTNNTWVYTGNGATIPNLAYYNLQLKPSGSSDQVLPSGTLTILGNLTIGDGLAGRGGATGVAGAPNINTVTLTISANNTFTTGAGIITLSGTGTPFLNSGPMTASTNNTFRYTGNGANVTANNYYNLELKSSGASNLNILTGTVNVAGNLVIGDGVSGHGGATALTSDPTINLSGSLTINQYATFITSDNQARAFTMSSTTPTVTVNGTLTISTNNTWKYTGNGAAIPNLAYYNLQLFSSSSSAQVLPPGTLTVLGAFLVGDGTAGHAGATAATYNTTVTVTGDLSVSANATYTTGTSLLTVGTLTINGTLAHGTGASSLTTGAVTINSGGSWTHSGTGTVTLSGNVTNNSGGIINLNSHGNTAGCGTNDSDDIIITAASAMSWSGTGTYTLVDVTMTNQTTAAGITVYSSSPGSDTSGNSGWTWDNCVAGITISGHVYSNEGTAALTTLPTVAVKVNGAGTYSDAADGAGYFEITNVTVAANNAVTVFLDGATEKATTVTLAANNSSNISLDLYQNRLILRHEGAMAISTIHLNQYDNACNAGTGDTDVVFCATDNDLTVSDGYKLIIWTGKTFEPSGSVTTSPSNDGTDSNVDGDFDIQAGATFTPATTVSIGGDFITTGTSVYSQATAWTFTATATGHSIVTNSYSSLGYVYFNGVGGGWDCDTVMGIDFDFVAGTLSGMCNIIASGSITGSGGIINIDGDVSLSDSVNLTENFGTTTGSSDWAMGNLNVQGAYGSGNQEFHLATGGTGAIIIHSNLVLAGMSGPSDFYAEDRTIVFDAAGWINEGNGTFYAGTSTVKYTSTTPTEISPVTSYYNLEVGTNVDSNAGIVYSITSGYFITVTGTLTIGNASSTNADTLSQAGTLSAGSVVVTSKGIWSNIGTEDVILSGNVSNAGTIIMNSNNGSQCTDGADDIVIKSSNSPDEVNGGGTDRTWTNTGGTVTIINVKAVDQAGSITAYTSTLISSGWSAGSCGVTVTGTFYSGEGTGALTTKPISIKVDGAGSFTGNTNGSGVYSISVTGLGAGKVVTVFVDGATEKATTVTRAANASSISGLDLYQNRLIVRHEDAGPITNANLNQYDNACSSGTGDTDVLFCSDGTNMTLSDGFKLIVWTGKTFTPGGTITTSPSADGTDSNVDGDVDIQTSATLTMGTNALSIGGDFALSGTFAPPTGQTVTFTATATGHEINVPTANGGFDNIVFNGAGGGWSMASAGINVEGDMTVTSGILSGGGEWYVKGGAITGNGTINLTSGGMRIDGTGNFGGDTNWSFNNLIVGDGTGTETTTATGTGDITVTGVLTVSANQTLDAGSKTWTLSGSGTPLVRTGILSPYSATFQYTGISATTLTGGDFKNLYLIPAATVTYTAPGSRTVTITGNVIVGDGSHALTLDLATDNGQFGFRGSSGSLTIAANAIVLSNTAYGFSFSGGSNTIADNTASKQDLGMIWMTGGDGTPTLTLNTSIKTGNLRLTVGTLNLGANTLELTGSGTSTNRPFQISGGTTFNATGGTVIYTGSSATDIETATYDNLGVGTTSDTNAGVTYSASSIGVNGVLTIGHASSTNSDTLALANYGSLTLNGSGTPFVITSKGSFTAGTDSLTMYYGTSATNIAPATYSALLIGVASPSSPVTYSLTGAITAASIQIGNNSGSSVTLEQGSYSVTTSGLLQVTSNGIWRNISTGDLVLGGSLQNSGSVIFNSNNGAQCTDGANDIVITSSTGGTQRDWTGAGTFTIYNVAATDQKSTTNVVTAYTSTLTNTTWTVGSCGITISGNLYASDETTPVTSGTVKMSVAAGTAVTTTAGALGAWSFTGVNPTAGQVITIWVDANSTTGASNASLVFKYGATCEGGTADCVGLKLFQYNVIIGVDYNNTSNSITNADLAACDNDTGTGCNGDTDIGFTSNAGALALTWTYNGLRIKDANAKFAPGGAVTLAGFKQSAGSFNGGSGTIDINGGFNISGGSFTSTSGNLSLSGKILGKPINITGGSFAANSGTVVFDGIFNQTTSCNAATFNKVVISWSQSYSLTVGADCSFPLGSDPTSSGIIVNNGTITTSGDWTINVGSYTSNSGAILTMTGATSLSITATDGSFGLILNGGTFPSNVTTLTINSGSLNNSGNVLPDNVDINLTGAFQTTMNCGNIAFNSIVINKPSGYGVTLTGGCTTSNFTRTVGVFGNPSSPYTLNITGNLVQSTTDAFGGSNLTLNFNGTGAQSITQNAGTIASPVTVNKDSNTLALATNVTIGALTVTKGTFSQATSYNLTVNGTLSIGASGVLFNTGTGDLVLGGDVSNAGAITLNSNNGAQCTDGADDIVITSSVGGTQRDWTGAGTFTIYNVSATDQKSTTNVVTAYTSTLTNTTWTVGSCGITISGNLYASDETTPVTTGTVKLSVAAGTAVTTAAGALGAWTFNNVNPTAGQVVTIWMDSGDTTGATNATLVFKYGTTCEGGTTSCTGLKLYRTKVIIGVDYNNTANSIANSDLAACDNDTGTGCAGDTDIGFTSELSTNYNLSLTWTTNVLRIKDANAKFSPGSGNVAVSTLNMSSGSYTTGLGTLTVSGTGTPVTVSGGSLTISADNTWVYTGNGATIPNLAYYNLQLKPSSSTKQVLPSGTLSILGALTVGDGTAGHEGATAVTNNTVISVTGATTVAANATFTLDSNSAVLKATFAGDLTINGTLNNSGFSVASYVANGNVVGTGTVTIGVAKFEQRVTSDKNFGTTSGSTNWDFSQLYFSNANSGAVPVTITTQSGGTGKVLPYNTLFVGKDTDAAGATTTLDAGNRIWQFGRTTAGAQGGTSTMLSISSNGILTANTSSFNFEILSTTTTLPSATFYNLGLGTLTDTNTGGKLTLAGDVTVQNQLTIGNATSTNTDTFDHGASYSLTVGSVNVASKGVWSNIGTGDVILSGNVSNTGTITMNSNNGAQCTDGTDDIVIKSSDSPDEVNGGGTDRTWTNTGGTITIINVKAVDQAGSITAYTSTLISSGWSVGTCGVSFNGTVYGADGQTALTGTAFDLKLFKNGGTSVAMTSVVSGTGAFSFTGVNVSAGDMVTIWMNTNAGADKATLIMKYGTDCTGGICGSLPLVKDAIVLASKNGAAQFTNADLSACNSNSGAYCNDTDIGYTSEAGFSTTRTLKIDTNATFAPGGDVTVGKLNLVGTYTGSTETLTITGAGSSATCTDATAIPLCGAGTFTAPDFVAFNTSSATTIPAKIYKGLTLGPSTAGNPTYAVSASGFTANGLMTVGQGTNPVTLDNSGGTTITLGNSLVLNSGTSYTKTTGWNFMLVSGTTSSITDNTAAKQDLGGLIIGSNGTHLDFGSDAKLTMMGVNCGVGCTVDFNGSHTLTLTGTDAVITDGFSNTTFSMSTGTVAYAGTSANIYPLAYNHLSLSGAGTYTAPASDLTIRGNLNIASGAIFTKSASNKLILASGGSQTITDSNETKQDLGLVQVSANGTDTTLNLGSSLKITKLTVDALQTLSLNGANTLTILGTGTTTSRPFINNGNFTASAGTVEYIGQGNLTVEALSYNNLKLDPIMPLSGITYDTAGAVAVAGNMDINPTDTLGYILYVNLGGNLNISGALNIQKTNSGDARLSTTASNYSVQTGSLTIGTGTQFTANGSTITLTGSGTPFTKTGTFNYDTSTVVYSGSAATNVAAIEYNNLTLATTSGTNPTYTNPNYTTVHGDFILGDGGNPLTFDSTGKYIDFFKSMTLNSGGSFIGGTTYLKGPGTITLTDNNATKQNLGDIREYVSPAIVQLATDIKIKTIDFGCSGAACTLDLNGSHTLEITGNGTVLTDVWADHHTIAPSTGTIKFTGTTVNIPAENYNHIILGGTGTYTMPSTAVTVRGDLTVTANATVTKGLGNVVLASGSTQTIIDNNETKQDLGYLKVSSNTTNSTVNLGSSIKATSFTVDSDQNLGLGANTLTLTKTSLPLTVNGNLDTATSTIEYAPNGVWTSGITIPAIAYYNLKINGPSFNYILSSGTQANLNSIDVTAGTLDLNTNDPTIGVKDVTISGTLSAPSANTLTVKGTWTNNGTFNNNSGTVTLDPQAWTPVVVTGSSDNIFYDLNSTDTGRYIQFGANKNIRVNNSFAIQGKPYNLIDIDSTTPGQTWLMNLQGTSTLKWVVLRNAGCGAGTLDINLHESVEKGGGNLACWKFIERSAPAAIGTGPGGSGSIGGGTDDGGGTGGTGGGSGGSGGTGGGGAGGGGGGTP